MEPTATPDSVRVADYGAMLRRRWWVVVVGAVLGLLLALELLALSTKTYTATTSVLVGETGVDTDVAGGRTSGSINLDTEAQLLTSVPVATAAGKALGAVEDPQTLAESVSASVPANTSVLQVGFVADTPEDAQRGAQAFATAYLQNREATAKSKVATETKSLQAQIANAGKNLTTVAGRIAALPENSPDRAVASAQQQVLIQQIGQLNARLNPLLTTSVDPGRIIADAKLPTVPTDPNPIIYLPGGLLLGALIGLGVAAVLQHVDKRVHSEADLRRGLGLRVVSTIPVTRPSEVAAAFGAPTSRAGQAFRRLRNLFVARMPGTGRIVLVSGVSKGVAGSVVAANLAGSLARGGADVVLVCADMRSSSSVTLAGLRPQRGLAEVLLGTAQFDQVLQQVDGHPRLRVVGPGLAVEAAEDRVQSDAMVDLMQKLQKGGSAFLVVEAPASAESADAQALAALADVVLIAVEARRTTRDDVSDAMAQFDRVEAEVLGAVVVSFSQRVVRWARKQSTAREAPGGGGPEEDRTAIEAAIDDPTVNIDLFADSRNR